MTNELSPFERLRRTSVGYQESCILAAAGELDVFTAILERDNRLTAPQVAELRAADCRGMTVLLDALAAMNYLDKAGCDDTAVYSVAEGYRELLDLRSPESFVPMLRHVANYQRGWTQLARVVLQGEPAPRPTSVLGEEEDRKSFILGMNSIARKLVGPTVASLKDAGILSFETDAIRFIDIGGASGTYTLAFLQALPQSEGTVFDLPVGIAAARQRFEGSEYEGRVRLVEGDFYRDEFPGGYDFAWISAIIHQHGLVESRRLFEKTFRALNPGGKVAVRDFMMSADRTSPAEGAYFGINMLVGTKNGRVYTFEEVRRELEAAGFTDVRPAVPQPTMSAVAVARKPG